MVRQYYVPQVTELSEQELQAVFEAAQPPVCLLGGWAVHLHVTPGFRAEHGREYIGSRDIDIGALEYVSDSDVAQFVDTVDDPVFEDAASLLQIEPQLISDTINRLLR